MIRFKLTNEERKLELIGSVFCEQYQTEAKFYVERSIPLKPGFGTGARHLVVQYGDGYTGREGLAVAANGQREFASMIPHDWSNEKLLESGHGDRNRWLIMIVRTRGHKRFRRSTAPGGAKSTSAFVDISSRNSLQARKLHPAS